MTEMTDDERLREAVLQMATDYDEIARRVRLAIGRDAT